MGPPNAERTLFAGLFWTFYDEAGENAIQDIVVSPSCVSGLGRKRQPLVAPAPQRFDVRQNSGGSPSRKLAPCFDGLVGLAFSFSIPADDAGDFRRAFGFVPNPAQGCGRHERQGERYDVEAPGRLCSVEARDRCRTAARNLKMKDRLHEVVVHPPSSALRLSVAWPRSASCSPSGLMSSDGRGRQPRPTGLRPREQAARVAHARPSSSPSPCHRVLAGRCGSAIRLAR